MPLDHYVSQVHLKNFYSPKLGNLMYAIRKSDLKQFTTNAKSVCRTEAGSTNKYLKEERAIEEFLKSIEPEYNASLKKLAANQIDSRCIYVIAGFIAYILTCSPTAMRIQSGPLRSMAEEASKILDSQGIIPPPPKEIGETSLTDLLNSRKLNIEIDPKYPQAIGIDSILSIVGKFGNFNWEILVNPFVENPFFTSDFPVAIEKSTDPRIRNRIIPLTPSLGLRIIPVYSRHKSQTDLLFSHFRSSTKTLRLEEVKNINKLIVRCAENLVFFRDNYDWIPNFVKKNAGFHIEPRIQKIPCGKGVQLLQTFVIEDVRNK